MLVSLRREYAHLVTSGAQLLLLLIGLRLESRNGWLACLSIMAAISILAWLSALNRLRTIRDTPTSKIASAAQGYVELVGTRPSIRGTLARATQPAALPVVSLQDRTARVRKQVENHGQRRK